MGVRKMQQRMQRRMQQDRARPAQMVPATALCAPALNGCPPAQFWGDSGGWEELAAGMRGLESSPGKGTAVDHEETRVRSPQPEVLMGEAWTL